MLDLKHSGRILYISSVDVSLGNGPGVNEREFILALHGAIGDRAHFLIPQPEEEVADLPLAACTFSASHQHHSPRYFPGHVLSEIRLAGQLLARQHFDLVLFRLDVLPIAPFYLTRRHPIPYALKTLGQGLMNALGERGGGLGRSLMSLNRWLVRQLVAGALVADSVSRKQVDYLQQLLGVAPNKIVWVDNAVNTDRFFPVPVTQARQALGLTQFDQVVGYVGNYPWERGGAQLVEALPRLLTRYPKLGVVILGGGAGLEGLKAHARELGVEDHCHFTGYVPFHKVPLYINSLDVGVSLSLRDDRQAASELKVRQYLACGKPVVASPGSNDFLGPQDLGSIVAPTDVSAIAAELDRWLSLTPEARGEFARWASQYVRQHLSVETAVARRFELWAERILSA